MDIATGERAPMAEGTTMAAKLDREEASRVAAREYNERLNQPRPDVPMPVPGALKSEHPGLVRPDQQEIAEMGGITNYMEYMGGEYEPKTVLTDKEKDEVKRRWELIFPDKENLYDLDDPTTGMIEYELMLADLRRGVLRNVGEPVEGYENKPVELAKVEEPVVETGLDISKIRNRRIREALKRLGGEDFVRDVWTKAKELTLIAPASEKAEWVMQFLGRPENGKRKLLAMTLSDWERMLVVRDDNGEEREVRLPDPGDGTYEKVLPLVRSLYKLNFRGINLPRDLELSEFLH